MGMANKGETLDWLYRLKSEIFVFMPKDWLIPFADALDVAIKALEQEPTTRNCFGCKYSKDNHIAGTEECHLCMWENQYTPTTKNDLGVGSDLISSITEKISEKVTESHEEFIFETIRPYCENVVQMKISKRDLEQAVLKYYGKNDLAVDWESYKDADGNSLDDLILEVLQNNFDCGNTYGYKVADEIIGLLPSVTPLEPKTGHWIDVDGIWFKCSECDAHRKMMPAYKEYYCPNCGAKMVEP